jgi:hypothetical protein
MKNEKQIVNKKNFGAYSRVSQLLLLILYFSQSYVGHQGGTALP